MQVPNRIGLPPGVWRSIKCMSVCHTCDKWCSMRYMIFQKFLYIIGIPEEVAFLHTSLKSFSSDSNALSSMTPFSRGFSWNHSNIMWYSCTCIHLYYNIQLVSGLLSFEYPSVLLFLLHTVSGNNQHQIYKDKNQVKVIPVTKSEIAERRR